MLIVFMKENLYKLYNVIVKIVTINEILFSSEFTLIEFSY